MDRLQALIGVGGQSLERVMLRLEACEPRWSTSAPTSTMPRSVGEPNLRTCSRQRLRAETLMGA